MTGTAATMSIEENMAIAQDEDRVVGLAGELLKQREKSSEKNSKN